MKDIRKITNAWASYDLANSAYNLVITATIFPIYYNAVTCIKDDSGNIITNTVHFLGIELKNITLYNYALAFAYLLVAITIPLLSGIADSVGNKKRFMQLFTYIGAVACGGMYFFNSTNLYLGICLTILACIGYAGSLVFYNAFLPEIASSEKQDKISAKGFAWGYIGSSVLLIISLILVLGESTGAGKLQMMRYSFLMVGIWWLGFSQISFYYLPNTSVATNAKLSFSKGYAELKKVWLKLQTQAKLKRFLLAFFIYSMGVQTVMLVANHFGSNEIKMESGQLITTILIIQFVAMGGSYLFAYISKLRGNIFTLKIATIIWAGICGITYLFVYTPLHFYIVAALVGLVMGGIQSLSRSTYSKMLPQEEEHAAYFSFYDVCEKMSIVFGMSIFGFINENSPSMRQPIVALILFFIIGYLLLTRVEKK